MFNVTRRVSFAIVIALTVGWGIFFLLFLASSNTLLEAQQTEGERVVALLPGVHLNVQVDKRVYRGGDPVLLAVRNDSRVPIWIKTSTTCPSAWWTIEQLGNDGMTWLPVPLSKQDCAMTGIERFTNHSVKTDTWMGLVPGPQIGDVLVNASTGTYRISLLYAKGKGVTADTWTAQATSRATSTQFTIQ